MGPYSSLLCIGAAIPRLNISGPAFSAEYRGQIEDNKCYIPYIGLGESSRRRTIGHPPSVPLRSRDEKEKLCAGPREMRGACSARRAGTYLAQFLSPSVGGTQCRIKG